jgi:hypothetical protein
MVYVLGAMLDPGDTVIVAVLGIIYVTPQHSSVPVFHDHANGLGNIQYLEQKGLNPNVDTEIAKTDASRARILLNCYIPRAPLHSRQIGASSC